MIQRLNIIKHLHHNQLTNMSHDRPTPERERSQEEIIAQIQSEAHHPTWEELCRYFPDKYKPEEKPDMMSEQIMQFQLCTYGSKAALLRTDMSTPDIVECMTHVQNIPDKQSKKDQTTLIYTAMKNLMQQTADNTTLPVSYGIITLDMNMTNWALEKGNEIFDWNQDQTTIRVRTREKPAWKEVSPDEFKSMQDTPNLEVMTSTSTMINPKT